VDKHGTNRATARMQLWAETLGSLAPPDRSAQLVDILNQGDRIELERFLGSGLFEAGSCIDVVETLTRILNFGPGRWEEQCEIAQILRPVQPSTSSGRVFTFPDGRAHFVTDAEWWAYYDRALNEPDWKEGNVPLLKALGILLCTRKLVRDEQLVTIDRSRTICFPAVLNPYEASQ